MTRTTKVVIFVAILILLVLVSLTLLRPRALWQPIDPPAIRPIGSAKNWMLTEPLTYRVGSSSDNIVVPIGFVTDFASIPPRLQSLISPLGPHLLPAVVHDFLYWEQGCSRRQADSIFSIAMTEMRVKPRDRRAMVLAVRRFGDAAWRANAADRVAGKPRIVPIDGVRRPGALEDWPAYREYLHAAGIRPGPPAQISVSFCAHGGPR